MFDFFKKKRIDVLFGIVKAEWPLKIFEMKNGVLKGLIMCFEKFWNKKKRFW